MHRGLLLTGLLVGAIFAAFYFFAGYDLATGSGLRLYSCRRYDPFGVSALREYLEEGGVRAAVLERPIPVGMTGTLVSVRPFRAAGATERGARRLLAWVEAGNRLVVFSRNPPSWLKDLGVRFQTESSGDALEKAQSDGDYAAAFRGTLDRASGIPFDMDGREGELSALSPTWLRADSLPEGVRVLARGRDGVVAVEMEVGAGTAAYVADPSLTQNFALARGDNLRFVLGLVGGGPVIFDEYSLGLGRDETVMDWLLRAGLGPFLLQVFFALFLLAWSLRGGRPMASTGARADAPPSESRIGALAALYRRNLTAKDIVRKTTDELARRGKPALEPPPARPGDKREAEAWAIERLNSTRNA